MACRFWAISFPTLEGLGSSISRPVYDRGLEFMGGWGLNAHNKDLIRPIYEQKRVPFWGLKGVTREPVEHAISTKALECRFVLIKEPRASRNSSGWLQGVRDRPSAWP